MLRKLSHFPSSAPQRRQGARGFTLLELMAVVILIGILAVIAVPGAAKAMRERRSSQAAHEIALLYNQARARAIARGSAVLVRYSYASHGFEVREAIAGSVGGGVGNCELAPAPSCTVPSSRWDTNSSQNQVLTQFRPLGTSAYSMVDIAFHEFSYDAEHNAVNTQTPAAVDICMSPSGRTFFRASNAASAAFAPMTGNHAIKVWMHDGSTVTGIERYIFIFPNGTARVGI